MNAASKAGWWRWLASAGFVGLIVAAAIVFRRPLVAWFTGASLGGSATAVTAKAGDFIVKASLDPDPPAVKGNTIMIELRDASDKPVDDATIELVYDMPAMGNMAEMKGGAKVTNEKDGHYRAEFDLPMDGNWTLPLTAHTAHGSGSLTFALTVGTKGLTARGGPAPGAPSPSEVDHYTCAMHPSVKQATPGKCPIRGMDLTEVTKEQREKGIVTIDDERRQLIGVRTGVVVAAPMSDSFHAIGRVAYDESKLADVSLRVKGWMPKLIVNKTGQRVAQGDTLFTLYSPDLYTAEQDFLLTSKGIEPAAKGARQHLRLLGLSDWQIDAVAKNAAPLENVAIPSPATGFVVEKNVVEGDAIDAGMRLYRIAALDDVWIEADIYETNLRRVSVGQTAKVSLDYLPGHSYEAKVSYVYPYVDPKSRTGRVRLELSNKGLELQPGMYADVDLATDLGSRLQVPASAVVYTGPRRLVFVDLGEGRFRPQEVHVGSEANGTYEVLDGLNAGDVVATSGVFLIAAEARISTAAKYWDATPESEAIPAPSGSAMAPMPDKSSSPPMPLPPSASVGGKPGPVPRSSAPAAASSAPTNYSCPMHPEVRSSEPGKCPKCGMDLVPTVPQP